MTYVDLGDVEVGAEFTGDGRPHRTGRSVGRGLAVRRHRRGPGLRRLPAGPQPGVGRAVARRCLPVRPASCATRTRPRPSSCRRGWSTGCTRWSPSGCPCTSCRIGPLYLIGIPGEVTIVAGLRLRRTVAAIVGADLDDVLVAGLRQRLHPLRHHARGVRRAALRGRQHHVRPLGARRVRADRGGALARAMVAGEPAPAGPRPLDLPRRTAPLGSPAGRRRPPPADFGRVVLRAARPLPAG